MTVFLFCIALCFPLVAGEARDLSLRFEVDDAHSAAIIGLAVSDNGKIIVTGSNDRSVRIWSAPDLELLRAIYLPQGEGIQGAAYTVAISPDAQTIAVAGWTGWWEGRENSWCFYIIGVEAGDITRTVCDMPMRANHVAYSPDGKFLAFALKYGRGLRVYRTHDYKLFAEDRSCSLPSTWVEFDGSGRLITACYDGKVRLYDAEFKLVASKSMPEGRRPDSLSFSPDGGKIVVGYDEPGDDDLHWEPAIDVISSTDLSVLYRPDMTGIDNGALWRVAWSQDSDQLFAGGTWRKGDRFPVRRWADGGRGSHTDLPGADSHVLRLRSLGEGRLVLNGERPYLAVLDSNGETLAERQMPTADFLGIGNKLGVSRDGQTVQFAFARSGRDLAYFSLAARKIVPHPVASGVEVFFPVMRDRHIEVRNWERGYKPTLNGEPLRMTTPTEHALSVSIGMSHHTFVLGTVWNVIRYTVDGDILWATQVPYNAHGVVIDPDEKFVVAALGDGSIRWYAMSTGNELLAFLPHRDGQRWVAWTPKGYFMASVGGEGLIGWHVNQGRRKEAAFFPIGRFRDQYYRPDIVRLVLQTLDEDRAIAEANKRTNQRRAPDSIKELLPPLIKIHSPRSGSGFTKSPLRVQYEVTSPDGAQISDLEVRVDGRRVAGLEALTLAGKANRLHFEVPLPKHDVTVSLLAWAARGQRKRASEEALVRLVWEGSAPGSPVVPRLFALIVGVSDYAAPDLDLKWAAQDARDIADLFERLEGTLYSSVETMLLTDQLATTETILNGFEWLKTATRKKNDFAVIFLAGHGVTDARQQFYFLPADVDPGRLETTSISRDVIAQNVARLAGRVVMFIDACHSANGLEGAGWGRIPADMNGVVNDLASPDIGAIMFASSTGQEVSIERDEWRNGAFTEALKEGLNGDVADYTKDGLVSTDELNLYLSTRVWELSDGMQRAVMHKSRAIPAFQIAARR